MTAFALTPRMPAPEAAADFPTGIQIQENEVDVGPPNPQFVSFDNDFALTYDSATGTVHVEGTSTGTGGGGGGPPAASTDAIGARVSRTSAQTSGQVILFDNDSSNGNWNTGNYSPITGIYTVPADDDGYTHRIVAAVHIDNAAGEGSPSFVSLSIMLNATQIALDFFSVGVIDMGEDHMFHLDAGPVVLAEGDQIKVQRSSGSFSSTIQVLAGLYTFFSVVREGLAPAGG